VRSSGITVFSNGSFDIFAAAHSVVFRLGGNQIEGQPRKKVIKSEAPSKRGFAGIHYAAVDLWPGFPRAEDVSLESGRRPEAPI
jgi:hypothetical protein